MRFIKSVRLICILLIIFLNSSIGFATKSCKPNEIPPLLINTLNLIFNYSSKTHVRSDLIDIAKTYVGTPYRSAGMKPTGFDCSGFVKFIYSFYGINLLHSSRSLALKGTLRDRQTAQPGDLVFFANRGAVHHVAMVYSNLDGDIEIIHSCSSKGVVIERLNDSDYWTRRLYCIRSMF